MFKNKPISEIPGFFRDRISDVPDFLYVALCLLIPPIWGVIAARLFDALARRRSKPTAAPSASIPTDDEWVYHI